MGLILYKVFRRPSLGGNDIWARTKIEQKITLDKGNRRYLDPEIEPSEACREKRNQCFLALQG